MFNPYSQLLITLNEVPLKENWPAGRDDQNSVAFPSETLDHDHFTSHVNCHSLLLNDFVKRFH